MRARGGDSLEGHGYDALRGQNTINALSDMVLVVCHCGDMVIFAIAFL